MTINYKHFTWVILIFLLVFGGINFILALTSDDIDDICNSDNNFLYRVGGLWDCSNFASQNDTHHLQYGQTGGMTTDMYLAYGAVRTTASYTTVAECNGSILQADYLGLGVGSPPPANKGYWIWSPHINGVVQSSLQWAINSSGGVIDYTVDVPYGNTTFVKGDLIGIRGNEVEDFMYWSKMIVDLKTGCHDV